jgi:Spy/CpxP family protein refolding chaperone
MDSLSFQQGCEIRALLKPQKAAIDSIHASFDAQLRQALTPEQLAKFNQRDKESKARREAERAKEPKRICPSPN